VRTKLDIYAFITITGCSIHMTDGGMLIHDGIIRPVVSASTFIVCLFALLLMTIILSLLLGFAASD